MEREVSRVVLVPVAPVALMLTSWWGTYLLAGDTPWIPWAALAGLAGGVLLDLTVLRSWTRDLFALSSRSLAALAAFYAVMLYGFFMGFPVPLLLIPLVWGFVAGRPRGQRAGAPAPRAEIATRGSTLIVLGLCCVTAGLAFREPSIQRQVKGMLGLAFTPSMGQLIAGSLIGGALLVVSAYGIARFMAAHGSRDPLAARPRKHSA